MIKVIVTFLKRGQTYGEVPNYELKVLCSSPGEGNRTSHIGTTTEFDTNGSSKKNRNWISRRATGMYVALHVQSCSRAAVFS